jgi:ribosome-binding factor A
MQTSRLFLASHRTDVIPTNLASAGRTEFLMRQFKRSQRLGVQIQRDISLLLQTELAGQIPGMVTLTHVKLSDDLRYARCFYSYLGRQEDLALVDEFFLRESKHLRSLVGRNLRIRHIPELSFKYDPSVEHGARIEQLLEEINKDRRDEQND